MRSVLTIGHSRHPLARFLSLLRQHGVETLADVRSRPVSRFSPHFSRKALERSLAEAGLRYLYLGDTLGGRPPAPPPLYQQGIERLVDALDERRVCVMCAEEDPAHCHRRLLIAPTLRALGVQVQHIRGTGALELELF